MPEPVLYVLAVVAGFVFGALVAAVVAQRKQAALRQDLAVAQSALKDQETLTAEREAAVKLAEERLTGAFQQLAGQSLETNAKNFLALAQENLGRQQDKAKADLTERQKAIESVLRPIRESLDKAERQINELEKSRQKAYGSITEQLQAMTRHQQQLQNETRSLVNALRRPEVRGRWGEITLHRLAELAGMVEHCDFIEQADTQTDEGRQRPDMIVRLPDQRELVVDVKTPLDAYLSAMESSDEDTRETLLGRHAAKVRDRVRELASKGYWSQFEHSPEFVILFIPGDQFLSEALRRDPDLLDEALRQKVILATPTSFIALLKAVAYGWRQVALADNARQIRELAEDLYKRLATLSRHFSKLGKNLGQSVDAFNAAVGSLERQVLPGARKFTEMGVSAKTEIEDLSPIDTATRTIQAAELLGNDENEALPDADDKAARGKG